MKNHSALIAIALAIITTDSLAADSAPGDTIIVTATRTEIPLSDAIVPVTVITREDIELSLATDLAELLRFQAGIDIGRNGGPGVSVGVEGPCRGLPVRSSVQAMSPVLVARPGSSRR